MPALQLDHPCPTFALPEGVDPESADSVRHFLSQHRFPSGERGRYLFAYDDEDEEVEVWLRHKLAGHREAQRFIRCAGGVHLLQMNAAAVNRVEYHFELLNREGDRVSVADPLNPASVRDPFGNESVIATSQYRKPAYVDEPSSDARGTLLDFAVPGPMGKPWKAWLWSPPSAQADAALPLVVFLDGSDWLQLAGARNILENLVHAGTIRSCRAVFLKPASRNEEYAANPKTAAFLRDALPLALSEFLPWPSNARDRIAIGVSLAALCLAHAHFTAFGAFGGLVLQSGSFFQPLSDSMETGYPHFRRICDFVSHVYSRSHENAARIPMHMTCGAGEENIINNRAMATFLREQRFPLTYHEQPDAHNWTCWRDSIGDGLRRMLAP